MGKPSKRTTGASLPYSADVTSVVNVTTHTNHLIYAVIIDNALGLDHYLQMFDAQAADVILGTTEPTFVIPVKASSAGGIALGETPLQFINGLSIASTTDADGSTTGSSRVSIAYAAGS